MEMDVLREALVEHLAEQNGAEWKTDAEDRVYDSRLLSIQEAELPLVNIFTPSDLSDETDTVIITSLELHAALALKAGESIEKSCGRLQKQLKKEVKAFKSQFGLAISYRGKQTDFVTEAAKPHALMTLTFEVQTIDQ